MTDRLHITPGRFEPPHQGHALTINSGAAAAKEEGAHHWIVPSRSEGDEKNPIPFKKKVGFLKRLFPGQKVIDHPDVRSPLFDSLRHASKKGYRHITIHAGEGRSEEYDKVRSYIKHPDDPDFDPNKHFPFKSFKVVQSGKRDASAGGVTAMSGTQARSLSREEYRKVAPTKDTALADEIHKSMTDGQNAVKAAKAAKAAAKAAKKAPKKTVVRKKSPKLTEEVSSKDFGNMLKSFSDFASEKLGIQSLPNIRVKNDKDDYNSFAAYNPSREEISVECKNRHPMDIFRSLAHELVHHKQKEENRIGHDIAKEGETGSDIENEANSVAGQVMRWYAQANPDTFKMKAVMEAIFVVGGPCSGKDKVISVLKEAAPFAEYDVHAIPSFDESPAQIIINASATDFDSISAANEMLKNLNYQTSMLFVDVENNISKLRNEQRAVKGQRIMNESVRFEKFSLSRQNKEKFEHMFERFCVVDNSNILTEEKMKNPCWKGYTAIGMKKKNGKKVPNCVPKTKVDEDFETHMAKSENRFEGTKSLDDIYKKVTPGQVSEGKKIKLRKKILATEDGVTSNAMDAFRGVLPKVDGIGSEYSIAKSPMLNFGLTGISESVANWAMKPETQNRFIEKYGDRAEQKLMETLVNLSQLTEGPMDNPDGMGMIPKQGKEFYEDGNKKAKYRKAREGEEDVIHQGKMLGQVSGPSSDGTWKSFRKDPSKENGNHGFHKKGHKTKLDAINHVINQSLKEERVDKSSMPCNKPKAQAVGDSLTGKSHVVKACSGGKEKVIRFGQRGVKGSPKKEGESEAYANRRKKFKARHGKNIKKGKMSAAYWANKVKW